MVIVFGAFLTKKCLLDKTQGEKKKSNGVFSHFLAIFVLALTPFLQH